ncbi:hypothetical protein B0J14DRAFT_244651 [Halenospora varia]|nr:hypothetical protein B0J14DRAFT_244651 [Halenospora varia]
MKAAYIWPAVLAFGGFASAQNSSAPAIDTNSVEVVTSYELQYLTTEQVITVTKARLSTITRNGQAVSTVTLSSSLATSLTTSTSSSLNAVGTTTSSRALTTSMITSTVIDTITSCINNPSCTNGHLVTKTTIFTTTCPVTQTGDSTVLVSTTTTAFVSLLICQ